MPLKSKVKIKTVSNREIFKPYSIKLVNTGYSTIYIISYGLLRRNSILFKSKKNDSILIRSETKEVLPSKPLSIMIYDNEIAEKCNLRHGDKVKLYAYFIDSKDEIFIKRFTYTINEQNQQ